jgi:phosphopantothenate synthetase
VLLKHPPNAKSWRGLLQIALIGEPADLTYDYTHLGSSAKDIKTAANTAFVKQMKSANNPIVIVGPGVVQRSDAEAVMRDILDLTYAAGGALRIKRFSQIVTLISTIELQIAASTALLFSSNGDSRSSQVEKSASHHSFSGIALDCSARVSRVQGSLHTGMEAHL